MASEEFDTEVQLTTVQEAIETLERQGDYADADVLRRSSDALRERRVHECAVCGVTIGYGGSCSDCWELRRDEARGARLERESGGE